VQVFPNVATAFADTSAFLRELTLKSMLILAPKVKHSSTYFSESIYTSQFM
jgi:SCY1-like protein 1